MAGLFHTLNVGAEALYATRQGVDTAGHNIANAQVEGFSRQRVNLKQRDPLQTHGGILIGNGAYVGSITRAHDKFIEGQLNKARQESGRAGARADAMKTLESVFSPELQANVSDEVSKFFGSLQALASFPADFTVRTAVVEAGKDLSSAFRRVDSELKQNRLALNDQIADVCGKVTDSLKEIASLNVKIQVTEAGEGQVANDLRDQRDRLLRDVSSQIEVHYYEDQHGMLCIRGPDQVNLVDGGHGADVGLVRNNDNAGLYDITITDWEGHTSRNVTRKLDGGALEAFVSMRDETVPDLVAKNNQMAFTIMDEFNDVMGLVGHFDVSVAHRIKDQMHLVASELRDVDLEDAILKLYAIKDHRADTDL